MGAYTAAGRRCGSTVIRAGMLQLGAALVRLWLVLAACARPHAADSLLEGMSPMYKHVGLYNALENAMYKDLYQWLPEHESIIREAFNYWDSRKLLGHGRLPRNVEEALNHAPATKRAIVFNSVVLRTLHKAHGAMCDRGPIKTLFDSILGRPGEQIRGLAVVGIEPLYRDMHCNPLRGGMFGKTPKPTLVGCGVPLLPVCFKTAFAGSAPVLAVPYPTKFHAANDAEVDGHLVWLDRIQPHRRALMSYSGNPHGKNACLRSMLTRWCKHSPARTCMTVTAGRQRESLGNRVTVECFARSVFCLQPSGDTPTRQSWFDAILAGCIPVFFSSCAEPDVFFERAYDPFLPAYSRTAFGMCSPLVAFISTTPSTPPSRRARYMLVCLPHHGRIVSTGAGDWAVMLNYTRAMTQGVQTIETDLRAISRVGETKFPCCSSSFTPRFHPQHLPPRYNGRGCSLVASRFSHDSSAESRFLRHRVANIHAFATASIRDKVKAHKCCVYTRVRL